MKDKESLKLILKSFPQVTPPERKQSKCFFIVKFSSMNCFSMAKQLHPLSWVPYSYHWSWPHWINAHTQWWVRNSTSYQRSDINIKNLGFCLSQCTWTLQRIAKAAGFNTLLFCKTGGQMDIQIPLPLTHRSKLLWWEMLSA